MTHYTVNVEFDADALAARCTGVFSAAVGALAEDVMIDYMTSLPMSIFVMDYDHNAPTPEYLKQTHEKMYRRFRAARPEIPIVFATMPKIFPSPDTQPRRDVIFATYEKAKAEGDEKVYLVDGMEMMKLFDDDGGLVDNSHPNDMGFLCMARAFGEIIEKILEEQK